MGGPVAKQYLPLGGVPVVARAAMALAGCPGLKGVVIVAPAADLETMNNVVAPKISGVPLVAIVAGGAERSDSVRNGLLALKDAAPDDIVLIHDGVRPFPPAGKFGELCDAAIPDGAILAIKSRDTVKKLNAEGAICATLDRESIMLAQTPQAFPYARILKAHEAALARGLKVTDDASVMEAFGGRVRVVEGDPANIKITTPEDMDLANRALGGSSMKGLRVGNGFDAHKLVAGRDLIIGGVKIEHATGLLGHSDADVLAHAIADAILGAAKLGDIGRHFPDNDAKWKGADSLKLLEIVMERVAELGGRVVNVDATLMAQRPKIKPFIPAMEEKLAKSLGVDGNAVNVKATTTEEMGFTGREEGMAAQAVVLLQFD